MAWWARLTYITLVALVSVSHVVTENPGDCVSGTHYSVQSGDCIPCPMGTYRTKGAQDYCVPCPTGFSTAATGAKVAEQCTVESCTGTADVVFVLDSSGSIKEKNWKKVLDFTKGICRSLSIANQRTRVGLLTFGNDATTEFHLNTYTTLASVLAAIDRIQWKDQNTYTHHALRVMREEMFTKQNGSRDGVPHIAIVMTDGMSSPEIAKYTAPEAKKAREANITIFVIGVGTEVSMSELMDIASSPPDQYIFRVENFGVLNTVLKAVVNGSCGRSLNIPSDCRAGSYGDVAAYECKVCPPGSYQPQEGQPACNKCKVTSYQDEQGQLSCKACHYAFRTKREGATSKSECTILSCPPGFYGDRHTDKCVPCPRGFYQHQRGAYLCYKCLKSTYQDQIGQVTCEPCPDGLTTYEEASPSIANCSVVDCKLDTYYDLMDRRCKPCPPGTYAPYKGMINCMRDPSYTGTTLKPTTPSKTSSSSSASSSSSSLSSSSFSPSSSPTSSISSRSTSPSSSSSSVSSSSSSSTPHPTGIKDHSGSTTSPSSGTLSSMRTRDVSTTSGIQSSMSTRDVSSTPTPSGAYNTTATVLTSTTDGDFNTNDEVTFSPTRGPRAGGTNVTFDFHKRYNGSKAINVTIIGIPCDIIRATTERMVCMTRPSSSPGRGPVRIHFPDNVVNIVGIDFSYDENPVIKTLDRYETILSGGLIIKIEGTDLRSIARPRLRITRVYRSLTRIFETECTVYTETVMTCPTPDLRPGLPLQDIYKRNQSLALNSPVLNFHISFVLDGVKEYTNLTGNRQGLKSRLQVYMDPNFFPFEEADNLRKFKPSDYDLIHVKGERLTFGIRPSDLTVQVGLERCAVLGLTSNQMTCRPPEDEPQHGIVYGPDKEPQVVVLVGQLKFTIGFLDYYEWTFDILQIIVNAFLLLLLIFMIIIFCLWRRRRRRKLRKKLALNRMMDTLHGADVPNGVVVDSNGNRASSMSANSLYLSPAVPEELKLKILDFYLDFSKLELRDVVGVGNFGIVYKGILREDTELPVAVKTVQGRMEDVKQVCSFLEEASIMSTFEHPNVLSLIGVALDHQEKPYVVLPFMENGDLKTFVSSSSKEFTVRELVTFGQQVADGMQYLAAQKFIHRDLAARNCMVDGNEKVKIADFGLSRDIYKSDYYRQDDTGRPLPVKWMAIESLTNGVFTTKSDVWAFGVLLWELLTRGSRPYADVDNFDIKRRIQDGHRLDKPESAPDILFNLMQLCWLENPEDRPTFAYLSQQLTQILAVTEGNISSSDYLKVVALAKVDGPIIFKLD